MQLKKGNVKEKKVKFIRYPGGKWRLIDFILPYIPQSNEIEGCYIEPFVGGGAVFFALDPPKAILSDINLQLINLYKGIKEYPLEVWNIYESFPSSKKGYYEIREMNITNKDLAFRAARILYLNRTCFKGMWRHNSSGKFNVGYGGQDRRWVINKKDIIEISKRLKNVILKCNDFESVIKSSKPGDFLFLDPPYKPGEKEITHAHYTHGRFEFSDYKRLAKVLNEATNKNVKWAMTVSSHRDILSLFDGESCFYLERGTGKKPGIMTNNSKEVLICNY